MSLRYLYLTCWNADNGQIDRSENLSLHLVLPPDNSTQHGTSSTQSPIPDRERLSSTLQQSNGNTISPDTQSQSHDRVATSTDQRPMAQGNAMPLHAPVDPQAQHGQAHGPLQNGQFPPQLQQAFTQFQAINQQLAASLAAMGTNPGFQAMVPPQTQAQFLQTPNLNHPVMHNVQLQQQQLQQQQQLHQQHARAAGVQAGPGSATHHHGQTNPLGTSTTQPSNASGPVRSSTPGSTNTIVRENHGLNGERWQMVIQSGQVNVNPNQNPQNHANAPPGSSTRTSPAPQTHHPAQSTVPSLSLMHLQSNLSAIEAAMAGGNPLPETVFQQARQMLYGIPDLPQDMQASLTTRLNNSAHRAHHLRENLFSHLNRAALERATAQITNRGAESSAVYVLSSPVGPQALLISPSGQYSTPWQFPGLGSSPQPFIHLGAPRSWQPTHPNGSPTNRQGPRDDAAQVGPAQQPAAQQGNAEGAAQVQQQQQVNQARDLIRIILPLGGHIWLLIRLFGFVYFFTAGAGWQRTILLGLVASLVFVAQTGIFRPVIHAVWDPLRRHAEGLVPLAGNERPHTPAVAARNDANVPVAQLADREPLPQEAAERLLQEREGRDVTFLRQNIRRIESALALFVASLVPGVGERHIAAREAAEAARQAEARERADRARREEEERQQAEGVAVGDGGANVSSIGQGAQNGAEQSQRPPLIEV